MPSFWTVCVFYSSPSFPTFFATLSLFTLCVRACVASDIKLTLIIVIMIHRIFPPQKSPSTASITSSMNPVPIGRLQKDNFENSQIGSEW